MRCVPSGRAHARPGPATARSGPATARPGTATARPGTAGGAPGAGLTGGTVRAAWGRRAARRPWPGPRPGGVRHLLTAKAIRACSSPCLTLPVVLITSSFHDPPTRTALATAHALSLVSRLGQMSATCWELPPEAS